MRIVLCFSSGAFSLMAQSFVVDASNGPGAHFTSIAAAVTAVPSGSTLTVRAGPYLPFTVDGKALTIRGEPGAEVIALPFAISSIRVMNTTAAQTVVVRDVSLRSSFGGEVQLGCTNCQGPVVLQRLFLDEGLYPGVARSLTATGCAQLLVDSCGPFRGIAWQAPGITVQQGHVVLQNADAPLQIGKIVQATNCDLHVIDTAFVGGNGQDGVFSLQSSSLRLSGATTVVGLMASTQMAISGSGSLVFDPSVSIQGVLTAGIAATMRAIGVVRATGGALGTTAAASCAGATGELGALFLAPLGNASVVSGVAGPVWIANGAPFSVAAGVFLPSSPRVSLAVTVPNVAGLLGNAFVWQGVTHGVTTGFAATNPAVFTP